MGVFVLLNRRLRAFTLIELMIVVSIIAFLSAILVPNFIRARERARLNSQARAEARPPTPRPKGNPPVLESAELDMTLHVQPLRVGLDVANRYQLEHQGIFSWSAGGPGPRLVLFELPAGADQIEGLLIECRSGQEWVEPKNLVYGDDFVAWEASPESFPLETRVAYGARGTDRLAYFWPHASKIRHLKASLAIAEQAQAVLPLGSLRPTEQADSRYAWTLENVLAPAPIEVELSAVDSPLGQAGRLFRLTGLALLLFGAGFWYLAELYKVGSLRDFGFGSFLLLALTYSSFFVSVAVLSLDGRFSPLSYLALSLALCLPLLTFHVSQLVDARFAVSRALPLALVTLSLVLLGVYGGQWRSLGFLALALLGLAFLTGTYRPFRRTLDQRAQRRQEILAEAGSRLADLKKQSRRMESLLLARSASGLGEAELSHLKGRIQALRQASDITTPGQLEGLEWAISNLAGALELGQEALEQLDKSERESRREAGPPGSHCCYCGSANPSGTYCNHCGSKLPLVQGCGGCGQPVVVPVHLLPAHHSYHCSGCGHRAGS
jgi:prepilin-type N-terminal cleavage/methylation domain-containing protein